MQREMQTEGSTDEEAVECVSFCGVASVSGPAERPSHRCGRTQSDEPVCASGVRWQGLRRGRSRRSVVEVMVLFVVSSGAVGGELRDATSDIATGADMPRRNLPDRIDRCASKK